MKLRAVADFCFDSIAHALVVLTRISTCYSGDLDLKKLLLYTCQTS
jgi:hypothetical protein